MGKTIIVYGSTTGNTEQLSSIVESALSSSGCETVRKNVRDISPEELSGYQTIILGCSTWAEGELQEDFISFEKGMEHVNLQGKKAAVFGPGDKNYPQFCRAVDVLEQRLKSCGADLFEESLKIQEGVDAFSKKAREWAETIAGEMICDEHKKISSVVKGKAQKMSGTISKNELKDMMDREEPVQIVNVLAPEYYPLGFIKGSQKIPLSELDQRSSELDRSKTVVVYCAHQQCDASRKAAEKLTSLGFCALAYEGGIKEWTEAGFPREG